MKALRVVSVFIGLGWVTTAASADENADAAAMKSALGKAEVTMSQAIDIAVKEVKGGRPYKAKLEVEDGKAQYDVAVMAGETSMQVEVDAASGKVLKVEKARMEKKVERWDFDKDPVGKPPPGWIIRQNNPTKELAKWIVGLDPAAPSKPNVLAVKTDNGNATFNLAIVEKTSYKDLDLSVTLRADSGKEDQGGGPIWRCKDENNYYVCRINPLENNYRVYKVIDGKRKMLKSIEALTPTGKWFTLRVTMQGATITCYLDGKKMLEAVDDALKEPGMIGLWTKADACSSFDDLTADRIRAKTDNDKTSPEAPKTEGREKAAPKD